MISCRTSWGSLPLVMLAAGGGVGSLLEYERSQTEQWLLEETRVRRMKRGWRTKLFVINGDVAAVSEAAQRMAT